MAFLHAGVFVVIGLLVPEILGFGILKAILSPSVPRIRRVKYSDGGRGPRAFVDDDPSIVLDFESLVRQHGYPAEEHRLTTIDGYKLVFHRIPGSPLSPESKRKPVVFMQHGFIASSDSWVLLGPGKDLAFLLADAGYDVWCGNIRGNTYNREHIVLSPSSEEFWTFSFHEAAIYDVSAMIDYALERSGQKSLVYVGHSMGTTLSYVLLSVKPEYNEKMRLVISMAPIAFFENKFRGPLDIITTNGVAIEKLLRTDRIFEMFPQSRIYAEIGDQFCADKKITQPICVGALFSFSGFSPYLLNATILPHLLRYFPAGASLNTLAHLRQNLGGFHYYDHGYVTNFALYGQNEPPPYNIKKVTAPVALFYGGSDAMSLKEDVLLLAARLPNVVVLRRMPRKNFSHFDFLWGTDTKTLLFDDILDLIAKYRPK